MGRRSDACEEVIAGVVHVSKARADVNFTPVVAAIAALHRLFIGGRLSAAREAVNVTFSKQNVFVGFLQLKHSSVDLVYCSLECFEVLSDTNNVAVHCLKSLACNPEVIFDSLAIGLLVNQRHHELKVKILL